MDNSKRITELLAKLTAVKAVSGDEAENVSHIAAEYLRESFREVMVDSSGNVTARELRGQKTGEERRPLLLLSAHLDEIGLVVTDIDEDGFLAAEKCGGADLRTFTARRVEVSGEKNRFAKRGEQREREVFPGIVSSVDFDRGSAVIDVGMSRETAAKHFAPGDRAGVRGELLTFPNECVSVPALDNRAGVAAVILACRLLKETKTPGKELNCDVAVLLTVQEEVGERGAAAAFSLHPDVTLTVDVTFAVDYGVSPPEISVETGKGVAIGIAPTLDRGLFAKMKALAGKHNVPFQVEVMAGKTGTDSDMLSGIGKGAKAALLSIPERNMHTPAELLHIKDIEAAAELIKLAAKNY
ncbi:aminopeptidase [Clostridia bacterium]|nr:aminopeptidase [Clostridia bacterium]